MAATAPIADAGFLVALLSNRDRHHDWAVAIAAQYPPPWLTCEAAISEAFHLLEASRSHLLISVLQREALRAAFDFQKERDQILSFLKKYSEVPMDFADACLVRMTETMVNAIVLTTDSDFRIYRRHGRQTVPCALPA